MCGHCSKQNCYKHLETEPSLGLLVPVEIDAALEELLEKVLREYLYFWYREISYDEDFVQEVRHVIRYAAAVLLKRLYRVDITKLIVRRVIPVALWHLDGIMHAENYVKTRNKKTLISAFKEYMGPEIHPAAFSRRRELEYTQKVTEKIIPYLIPARFRSSKPMFHLLTDVVCGAVLQPVLDLVPDPDLTVNLLIDLAFTKEPSKKFGPGSGNKVEFLDSFVKTHQSQTKSALQMDLSAILKNELAMYAFMEFLKKEHALSQIQFCLSVEDFNKQIMTPELTEEDLVYLHGEAMKLYNMYFKSNAEHKVSLSPELASDIFFILNGPASNVIQLRTTTPLFKAYEEVYSNLETKMCPAFYRSEEYFDYLLGNNMRAITDHTDKQNGKLRKNVLNVFKKTPKSKSYGTPKFYVETVDSDDDELSPKTCLSNGGKCHHLNGSLLKPLLLSSTLSSSEIDLTRASALASINSHLSVSTGCLLKGVNGTVRKCLTSTPSEQTPTLNRHKRSKSTDMRFLKGSDANNVMDMDPLALFNYTRAKSHHPIAKGKSSTFPQRQPPVNTKMSSNNRFIGRKLKKSVSLLSSPVRHLIGQPLTSLLLPDGKKQRSKNEGGSKPTEKIGRGLSKIKQGVLGKSTTEGIIDTNVPDPAFDIADMYEDADPDETLSVGSNRNLILEHRDLSAWRVSIPKLSTGTDGQGKACFIFVIDVQRIDIAAQKDDAEDLHWTVERRYSEFYVLESKLTEFHGEFEDLHLPPKAKLFMGKGLDVMQSKKQPFEEYLSGLLQKPFLKESDILFTFLTSPEEFTVAASNLGLGKIMKTVPIKLTKEKGQSLQPFIDSFVGSTLSPPPKPRYDSVIGNVTEHDDTRDRVIVPHRLFDNTFDISHSEVKRGEVFAYYAKQKVRQETGVYDTLVFLAANLFKVTSTYVNVLLGLGIVCRNTFDWLVNYAISSKLAQVLCCRRVAFLCHLLQGALFETHAARNDEDKRRRKEHALEHFQNYLRPFVEFMSGRQNFEEGTQFVFDALQEPTLNKQLVLVLFDIVISELFPELETSKVRK